MMSKVFAVFFMVALTAGAAMALEVKIAGPTFLWQGESAKVSAVFHGRH